MLHITKYTVKGINFTQNVDDHTCSHLSSRRSSYKSDQWKCIANQKFGFKRAISNTEGKAWHKSTCPQTPLTIASACLLTHTACFGHIMSLPLPIKKISPCLFNMLSLLNTFYSNIQHCFICSSDCCPGLQCGYEAGLSWGDGNLHLHCQTRSFFELECLNSS